MKSLIPFRSLGVLLVIGFIDLIATAVLHEMGLIVELNPLMRFFIEQSEWLFALVKGMTLVVAWVFILRYSKTHREFADRACWVGSAAYLFIWISWMVVGTFSGSA